MATKDLKHPDLASRLNHVMDVMGWTQTDLAKEAGAKVTTVNNWIKRNRGLRGHYAFALQDKHRWQARWLIEGVGPIRSEISEAEAESLLELFQQLPADRRNAIKTLLSS